MSSENQTPTGPATTDLASPSEEASPVTAGRTDWGDMNRELLAEQLRAEYHASESQTWYYESYVKPRPIEDGWVAVANKAISILLETPQ